MKHLRAIHQFHGGSAYGDGVTNGMLFTRRLLRSLGLESEIYVVHVAPELAGEIRSIDEYRDGPDQLLIVQYSMGHDHHRWVEQVSSPKILAYHNITPAGFFSPDNPFHRYSNLGRRQIADWAAGQFAGAVAMSTYSADELVALGYGPVATIPLLVDLERLRQAPWDRGTAERLAGPANILFVGRICENKCQHELVEVVAELTGRLSRPVRLLLVGGESSAGYGAHLRRLIAERGLDGSVVLTGKIPEDQLYAHYRAADLFLCLSEHEGFGMPLVEATAFDVPVLAYAGSCIAETLGSGGILFDEKSPDRIAAAARLLLEEPPLRRRVLQGQRDALARYRPERLIASFISFLNGIGFAVPETVPEPAAFREPVSWRIEGPFDSSYSLAIVNREVALGLRRGGPGSGGEDVALCAMDGPGRYPADQAFLAANPEAAAMWERGLEEGPADVVMRNMYPPRVDDMKGVVRGLLCYGWEESGFPAEWVDGFNRTLDVVTVLSSYTGKVLEDNGVTAPVHVAGTGIDHVLSVPPSDERIPELQGASGFGFLHISSCFPRKGADVLLEAWGRAFDRRDPVYLVVKTFPNPHNEIERQLADLKARHPDHAPVFLINRDLPAGTLATLYRLCDAFVSPTRGEGFGMPMAEAMLYGMPVVVTAYGGQADFCTDETAWLVDYRFAYARTHFNLPHSVWAEPCVDDLARAMRAVRSAPPEERRRRTRAAAALIRRTYGAEAVAARVRHAVGSLAGQPVPTPVPRVAWVSTWNARCGIASYSMALAAGIPPGRLTVLANRNARCIDPDGPEVVRCWDAGWSDPLDELHDRIIADGADSVVLQFNFGLFQLAAFARLIDRLVDQGRQVHVFLHATADVRKPDLFISLSAAVESLRRARRLFVHGVHDLNCLKGFGLVDNVALFPMGQQGTPDLDSARLRREYGLADRRVIASFGFLLPHKGLRELLQAFSLMRGADPDLHLLMANALYPAQESADECAALRRTIDELGLGDSVTLLTDYLEENVAIGLLTLADAVVYPYQHTQESASAAVRMGLASGRPVAVTPLAIFDDVSPVTIRLPGTSPEDMARGLAGLLEGGPEIDALLARQRDWLVSCGWERVSGRLWNIIRAQRPQNSEETLGIKAYVAREPQLA
ncbi:glycosyltransferase [Skermanella sp. TT6]|uniref:Glycosyltransferase n=1 Tax=Skermanella cutis TaxID=2775420 RepID=A0ABX7B4E6_9PROT|nr:glycosyltransferase [Skermanella sp. TT6]QQP89229.1 glycosyltransferase [Skermanella sp. TT6]